MSEHSDTERLAQRHAQGERILQAILHAVDSMNDKEGGSLDVDMIVSALASALGTYIGNVAKMTKFSPKKMEEWAQFVQSQVVIPIAHKGLRGEISPIKHPYTVYISTPPPKR